MKLVKWILGVFFVLFLGVGAQAQAPQGAGSVKQKHALVKIIEAPTHPVSGLKNVAAKILFFVEVPVDGVHAALYSADKAFDFVSIAGKVPVLDMIYSAVSIGNTDVGKLDAGIESLEVKLTGTHN